MEDLQSQFDAAVVRHRQGDVGAAEAVYRSVLTATPDHADAHHMMAVVYLQKGQLANAADAARQALHLKDTDAKFHNTLGNILVQQGKLSGALSAFETASTLDPTLAIAAFNKGTVLLSLGRPNDAEAIFRHAIDKGAQDVAVYNNLASALIRQGQIAEAVTCCRDGMALHQDHPELGATLASALELSNDLPEAEIEARKTHAAFPNSPLARLILARVLRRRKAVDDAYDTLTPLFDVPLSPSDEAEAHYEMGLIQDVRKKFTDAFRHFSACNTLLQHSPEAARYDGDRYRDNVQGYRHWIGRPDRPAPAPVVSAPRLVFFVGFPRSGTTLMEQVLKSHPDVVTTEEISPLSPVEAAARRLAADQRRSYPACLDDWGTETLNELRRLFLAKMESISGPLDGRVLVDKLPLNIVSLGLVEKLWPDARVLVALRDPRDVCLSCFIQRFTPNNAMVNFLDIKRTGALYADVMGLWLQYRNALTLTHFEYRYEDLVDDFEAVTRRILNFIGVGWHDAVSTYRDDAKQRVIRTPSYREVTAPVHKKAVARWRNYEQELAPLSTIVAPFVSEFDYDE